MMGQMKPLPLTCLVSALREESLELEPPKLEAPRIIVMRLCADGVRRPINRKLETLGNFFRKFWGNVEVRGPDECWEWTKKVTVSRNGRGGGYGYVSFRGQAAPAHRMSYAIHHKQDPYPLIVCHQCDNRKCVNPSHLFLGTDKDNVADRIAKKRRSAPLGERHNMAVLNEAQVREIRAWFDQHGKPNGCISALARQYKVTRGGIQQIWKRKTWQHITNPNYVNAIHGPFPSPE